MMVAIWQDRQGCPASSQEFRIVHARQTDAIGDRLVKIKNEQLWQKVQRP
jgi:hypothetical protein